MAALPLGQKAVILDAGPLVAIEAYEGIQAKSGSHESMILGVAGVVESLSGG
jgi:hypothetical protein